MNQLSSMVKTFVEGQEAMLESLDEMIERQSQEQVSKIHCARNDFCQVASGLLCHHLLTEERENICSQIGFLCPSPISSWREFVLGGLDIGKRRWFPNPL